MKTTIIAIGLLSTCSTLFASENEHRHHGAHEHGVGKLNLVIENNTVSIDLESPAINIVGFEHAPENEQQHHAIEEAIETLYDGNKVFVFNGSKCRMTDAEVETGLVVDMDEHEHDDDHEHEHEADHHDDHDHEHEGEHADFDVSYQFSCNNAAALTSIDIKLFELFSGTEELQVQMITNKGQTAVELDHDNTRLNLAN